MVNVCIGRCWTLDRTSPNFVETCLRESLLNSVIKATTTFEIVEPPNFRLHHPQYKDIEDNINGSNIENWLKILLKNVSSQRITNQRKFLKKKSQLRKNMKY